MEKEFKISEEVINELKKEIMDRLSAVHNINKLRSTLPEYL